VRDARGGAFVAAAAGGMRAFVFERCASGMVSAMASASASAAPKFEFAVTFASGS